MRKILTLLAVLLTIASHAQTKGKIEGRVEDNNGKTVESATVTLLKAKDSSVAKVGIVDKSGKFEFDNLNEGRYLIYTTAVGYAKAYSSVVSIDATNSFIQLQTISLVPSDKSLGSVTVTAKKQLIEHKIDRMVVNVDASVTNVGSTALEVLEKSPGITVDKDGNISLKGKQGVVVLVDGRPTQLGGADLANLLRSMNASQMDQVEIMTNPPAKYDAAGNAGVINIKTKKNKQFGYNGTLTLGYGQGRFPKFNEGINFNYRQGKVNVFTNLSHNYRKRFQELDIQRNFLEKTSKQVMSHFDQEARMINENNSFNAKLGVDYFASKNSTFGVVFTGYSNPGKFQNRNHTDIYTPPGVLASQTNALSKQDETWKNFSTNINFRQVLDTAGKEFTADLDYVVYDANNIQSLSNYYLNAFGNTSRKGDTLYGSLPQNIKITSGRVDYLQPLKKGARFEAGLKTSFVKTINDAVYDTVHNGRIMRDLSRTNGFDYTENINAAYVNLSTPLSKKINAQLGLRLENTIAEGYSDGYKLNNGTNEFYAADTTFKRNYTQLFPTAYFQYKANEKNNFGLNYGRRIRRPNYESLNPFIEYLDRYTYQQGNPNLKPQFSHNIDFSHTYKGFLTTTLNYTNTNNILQQVIEQNTEKNETYVKQDNIAKQRQFGIAVSANMPITKWWTSNIYINAFNNRFEGVVDSTAVAIEATSYMLNGSQQFKLNKKLSAEVSGFFRSAGIDGVFQGKSIGMLSVGFSKQVMKGKGSVRLNVRDILWSQRFRGEIKYGTVDAKFQERGDSRVVNVGFTYRFNKGKMNGNTPKRRSGSANDEQSRVGGN